MAKEIKKIGLNELELTNDDIFVRKTVTDFGKDDVVIVHETHSAMLLKDGKLQDTLEAGRYPLFEIQKKFFGLVKEKTDTEVDLIYVSKTAELPVRWGTPTQFTFRDPLTGIPARVGASGEFGVKVKDPVMLYKVLIGASREFSVEDLRNRPRVRMPKTLSARRNAPPHRPAFSRLTENALNNINFLPRLDKAAKGMIHY